jgi:hypothetical protein
MNIKLLLTILKFEKADELFIDTLLLKTAINCFNPLLYILSYILYASFLYTYSSFIILIKKWWNQINT